MTQLEYAKMIRTMHRIMGWCFIASIIFIPLGMWILRRGNRIYEAIATPAEGYDPETELALDEDFERSIAMSWDDVVYREEED